jgi:hypothetical protein
MYPKENHQQKDKLKKKKIKILAGLNLTKKMNKIKKRKKNIRSQMLET